MAPSAISTPVDEREHQYVSPNFNGNGISNRTTIPLSSPSSTEPLDLLCIGFGPASLAIAIALHDLSPSPSPNVLFLEQQAHFAWHSGMQLPSAKMQISFLKDLATPRNPRSKFTFINYLFEKGRLNTFINLGTFLPSRLEYEDYLRWCAGQFEREGSVRYGAEVQSVQVGEKNERGEVKSWEVCERDIKSGEVRKRKARHVVIAVGGKAVIPPVLEGIKQASHSSKYASSIQRIQKERAGEKGLRFVVLGSGQSAAEIFNDLWERFPDANVKMVIKGASLRPSDDSPFVNEIFDPSRVSKIYAQSPDTRSAALSLDRGTNYGVVRLSLLEHLYEKLYMQRLTSSRPSAEILSNRTVISASQKEDSKAVVLRVSVGEEALDFDDSSEEGKGRENKERKREEILEADYIFTATGYKRNAHIDMLSSLSSLTPKGEFEVRRDYGVRFKEGTVGREAGIWLQGCNEGTHGLSDTLLSILAIRGGELVESIFGPTTSAPTTPSSESYSSISIAETGSPV